MATLPQELYDELVQWTDKNTLCALAQTSKAFRPPAERLLYRVVLVRDAQDAFNACLALEARDGERGPYARKFWFYYRTSRLPVLPERFWQAVRVALTLTVNLDTLALYDPTFTNTWVLSGPEIKFQLREANLGLQWDKTLVDFLETQDRLVCLHVEDSLEDSPLAAIAPGKLDKLRILHAPPLVVAELLVCPLTHLQIEVDSDTAAIVPTVMLDVGRIMRTLLSLQVTYLPENMALEVFHIISTSVYAPTLYRLGALPYPVQHVSTRLVCGHCGTDSPPASGSAPMPHEVLQTRDARAGRDGLAAAANRRLPTHVGSRAAHVLPKDRLRRLLDQLYPVLLVLQGRGVVADAAERPLTGARDDVAELAMEVWVRCNRRLSLCHLDSHR